MLDLNLKGVLLVCATRLLTGCTPSPMDKTKQDYVCKDKGGVYRYTNLIRLVTCNNGSKHEWSGTILTEGYYHIKVKEK